METGERRNRRCELEKALALCRKHKARLVIAKLDPLSRNLAFIATLLDSGVEFVAVDNPHAKVRLGLNGSDRLAPSYRASAIQRAQNLAPLLIELKQKGMPFRQIATELTDRNVPTAKGGKWVGLGCFSYGLYTLLAWPAPFS